MIGKSSFLAVLVGLLLSASAGAATTSQNIDIIVTHGASLTTFTFQNDTGATLPAGTPVTFGQAFRYGDIMPGTYPVVRDAGTHAPLAGQQWDEIDTFHENGSNGSWRHAVWSAWLPTSVAAGATYTVEFVFTSGTYSQTSHQALSALCSGPGAHDFKIDLADVRNQDDTARDSGHAVFRVCDNIANTGRDAPRHLRAGNAVDEYEVRGMFVYAGTGHQDPLLYAICDLDLFTDAADGTSLKDIRHVCTVHNSWQNVSAGSRGNAGNPGPAGFANDPQAVVYIPRLYDGATNILDWSNLGATLSSASNPVQSGNCLDGSQGSVTMTVPGSTGSNTWPMNETVRVSTTGTALGGLTAGRLYWVYNCGITQSGGAVTNIIQLTGVPQNTFWPGNGVLTSSQGTGTTTFTPYFWHGHLEAWQALDQSTDENWATRGSTARFTRRLYPKLSQSELRYWASTGLWEPLNLSQPSPHADISYLQGLYPTYNPFSKGIVFGTGATGERPDLGFISEYQAVAQIAETEDAWYKSRLFTLGETAHSFSTILDESTGRIPALNNGPPTGPGGNGVGGTYTDPATGLVVTPQPTISWSGGYFGLAAPLQSVPNSLIPWHCGNIWAQCGTYVAWMPSFDSYTYMVFGSRHFLDMIYFQPNRDLGMRPSGNYKTSRDDTINGNHYWGLAVNCCQIRGSAWSLRDMTYAAALGGDANNAYERQMFADEITENLNYYHLLLGPDAYGEGANNLYTTIAGPDIPGGWTVSDTYILNFVALASWGMDTFLHAPAEADWLSPLQRHYEGVCGARMYGSPPPYYCIDYTYAAAVADGDSYSRGGTATNAVDASDWGNNSPTTCILSGGFVSQCGGLFYSLTAGDRIKNEAHAYDGGYTIDQLPGNQWFTIVNPNNGANKFQIQCPVGHPVDATCPIPGGAFTDFTHNGTSLANVFADYMNYRPQYDPGAGYARFTYVSYGGNTMELLKITGHDLTQGLANFNARSGSGFYNSGIPSQWWDDTIVVPGLPAVVTYGNQFPIVACASAPGTILSSLGLIQGNDNPASAWAQTGIGDNTDFAISGNNLVVGPGGISAAHCGSSQVVQVLGTQTGGGPVLGQVNIRIGP